jgi:crossover junction endodeoxyribonuclease RuvC
MRILGIDPGTATVGWGVIESDAGKVSSVGFGHISTSKDLPAEKRLAEIATDIEVLIKQFDPEEAAVEELFFYNNQKTVISVAQARGVILLTLERFGVRISGYTPLEVKQALTNYGRADKAQVQLMTKNILKLKEIPKPDDAADALAIAVCHASRRKMELIRKNGES